MDQLFTHRLARPDDFGALMALLHRATLGLNDDHYDLDAMRLALKEVPLLTPDLVDDGHYHVLTGAEGAILAGGGWSCRAPGYAAASGEHAAALAPGQALVRAVNVDPTVARRGLGSRIMAIIEADAAAHGVRHLSLTATLPGKQLYDRLGYRTLHPVEGRLSNGYRVSLYAMEKVLSHDPDAAARPVTQGVSGRDLC
ncbi:GNAT family N-acetyltransferase [Hoeflea prorocentri]|uniref:GNAT family N-acetyltransferase n=1 Tax=Hoeflea prorocentri TaxID=1922333 RepID=A0A9X3UN36_9HYPH|nr:GNAT family N-acetyltransferase [Hoeflea prorocentri]MCY6382101.1 GNAT family N-acetyltransferase [Hoeflea prorocentri]MDA5399901.1 GNAT family N-acetyltransferase [Hoeflea prorocentri]